jgi:hypothetical protein
MAYQTHHCSDAFHYSVCLIAFLHKSLVLSILFPFMLYAPYPFTTHILFRSIQLLHSPSSHMNHLHQLQPQQTPTATTTFLFSVPCIYSFCASCACNIHHSSTCSYHPNLLHLSIALRDHHRNSSFSLAIFPRIQHHWMLC